MEMQLKDEWRVLPNMNWKMRHRDSGVPSQIGPDDFLASVAVKIPKGKVLSLGDIEGRNAVHLASLGYHVTAIDASAFDLRKAIKLADRFNVNISVVLAAPANYQIMCREWDGIISWHCHLPSKVRIPFHNAVVRGLKPGGVFVCEDFSGQQINCDSDMLMSLSELQQELEGLELVHAVQTEREIGANSEPGRLASVVQVVGIKPGKSVLKYLSTSTTYDVCPLNMCARDKGCFPD